MGRLVLDNQWWSPNGTDALDEQSWHSRTCLFGYVDALLAHTTERVFVLQGPRQVGKTVLLKQLIAGLIQRGVDGRKILYLSFDVPVYEMISPEAQLREYLSFSGRETGDAGLGPRWVFLDEIQYLDEWERKLDEFAASHPAIRFVACSSARKYRYGETGYSNASEPVHWLLPPLSFAEYLRFIGRESALITEDPSAGNDARARYQAIDIAALNAEFLNFLNFGGFPAAAANADLREQPTKLEGRAIIRSVLHRDLSGLYGIGDTRDLNRLYNFIAYNTGRELTLKQLSRSLELGKAKVYEYLEHLEATCLIRRLSRIDDEGEPLQRVRSFKAYLTNQSMWSAMFGLVGANDPATAKLAETAVYIQVLLTRPMSQEFHYARWKSGRQDLQIDFVSVDRETRRPMLILDVQGFQTPERGIGDVRGLRALATKYGIARPPLVLTWQDHTSVQVEGMLVHRVPVALYCYAVGKGADA